MAQNFNPMTTQNILNISRELGITPHYAMNLVKQSLQGIEQGPLDMFISELTQQTLKPQTAFMPAPTYSQVRNPGVSKVIENASKNTIDRFLQTPLIQSLGRAGSTALKGIGTTGDLYMLTEAAKQSDNRLIYNDNPMSGFDFNNMQMEDVTSVTYDKNGNPIVKKYDGPVTFNNIQLNNDGSIKPTLQGQVNYDEYLLEPNDNIWVQPVPNNTRF